MQTMSHRICWFMKWFITIIRVCVNCFPHWKAREDIGRTALVCDTRLLDILMGKKPVLSLGTAEPGPDYAKAAWCFGRTARPFISGLLKQDDMPLILLWGPRGSGKRLLLVRAAAKAERELIFFDASVNAPLEQILTW